MKRSFLRSEYIAGRYQPTQAELPFALTEAGREYEARTRKRIKNLCAAARYDPTKSAYVRMQVPFINEQRNKKGFVKVECSPPLPPV